MNVIHTNLTYNNMQNSTNCTPPAFKANGNYTEPIQPISVSTLRSFIGAYAGNPIDKLERISSKELAEITRYIKNGLSKDYIRCEFTGCGINCLTEIADAADRILAKRIDVAIKSIYK